LEVDLSNPKIGKIIFKRASYGSYAPIFSQETPSLEEIFKRKAREK
jgi:ABC-2 type transport system ATP-binding protein